MMKMVKELKDVSIGEIGFDLKRTIIKSTANLPKHYTVLMLVKTKNYNNLIVSFLDLFINDQKGEGIYLTTNKTFDKVETLVKNHHKKIDMKKIFFIDCMSGKVPAEKSKHAIACPPQNLTDLNITIGNVLNKRKSANFLIVDSLSTFFIYNKAKEIEKFIRSVVKKVGDRKIKSVFITTKTKATESAIEDISLFFDEVLTISI